MPFDLPAAALKRTRSVFEARGVDFTSNDYLNFAHDLSLREAYQEGFQRYAPGSGGSMLLGGYQAIHQAFEEAFCEALQTDAAVLCASGYVANLGLMQFLATQGMRLWIDKRLHASFYDGLKLGGATYQRYAHQAYDALERGLSSSSENQAVILESVYSMGGHQAPLSRIANMGNQKQALLVDEAHAFGLYGPKGLGQVVQQGLTQVQVPLRIIPFGKAMHGQGAIIAGRADWIEALIQVARGYIYSTGVSPAYTYGLKAAFEKLQAADERRAQLRENVFHFKQLASQVQSPWMASDTPIQHLKLGNAQMALDFSSALNEKGLFCRAIRSPTVPVAEAGIRVVLNAGHQRQALEKLIEEVEALWLRFM